jgi:hypothetical protein
MDDVVIVSGSKAAVDSFGGALNGSPVVELGALPCASAVIWEWR